MMRWLPVLMAIALMWPASAVPQSRTVLPDDLQLSVTVEKRNAAPYVREMVLISIRGVYRRHITRETLVQPDLEGFSWSQLGTDVWREERIDGARVKTFERRMALYPDRAGTLTIGAFTHDLTLTDEGDDWFAHQVRSEPISIDVEAPPTSQDWWFPVKSLKVADQWSNAPDQLAEGDGVLRVIRIEALGATQQMIPPMPELRSPSAMIFAHPDKRLVELTPEGPVTYAFWRWTIRPTNGTSAIVEPLRFSYFDTELREHREVTISAQRVAYGTVTPDAPAAAPPQKAARLLPPWALFGVFGVIFGVGTAAGLWGRKIVGMEALHRYAVFDPLARSLRQAARAGDLAGFRRAALSLGQRDGHTARLDDAIRQIDRSVFGPNRDSADLDQLKREILAKRGT